MTEIAAFRDQVLSVWEMSLLGLQLNRVILAAVALVFFLLLRRAITFSVFKWLRHLARRTQTKIDDLMLGAVEQPFMFMLTALALFVSGLILGLEGDLAAGFDRIIRTFIAVSIFWGLFRLVKPAGKLLAPLARVFTETLIEWLMKGLKGFFLFLGAVSVLTIWGIPVMPVLASLSLLSVAVALGAQDFFKNLIGGLLIIVEKRFLPGDWILVDGVVEGTVEKIDFRSTSVRRFDKALVNVPNATLSDSAVVNYAKMTHRRIYWKIGVEYGTTLEQLRTVRNGIEAYVLGSDDFAHPPEVPVFVRIDAFSDSSIDIMLYCFTKTTVWGDWLEIKERLACRIKKIVEEAGTGFAFPSRTVYLEHQAGGESPVPFHSPEDAHAVERSS